MLSSFFSIILQNTVFFAKYMYIYIYLHILFSRERHLLRAFCLLDTVLTAENLAVKNQADTTKFIVVKPDIAG